jgi:hypothetical protein
VKEDVLECQVISEANGADFETRLYVFVGNCDFFGYLRVLREHISTGTYMMCGICVENPFGFLVPVLT